MTVISWFYTDHQCIGPDTEKNKLNGHKLTSYYFMEFSIALTVLTLPNLKNNFD